MKLSGIVVWCLKLKIVRHSLSLIHTCCVKSWTREKLYATEKQFSRVTIMVVPWRNGKIHKFQRLFRDTHSILGRCFAFHFSHVSHVLIPQCHLFSCVSFQKYFAMLMCLCSIKSFRFGILLWKHCEHVVIVHTFSYWMFVNFASNS